MLNNISVVIATFNGEKYIEEQLDSIINQTVLPDEVKIFDDCSTDNTVKIIQEFIKNNKLEKTWQIIINKKNKGYAKNFIEGALNCTKDIIFFCDQDDIWENDKIEIMYKCMVDNNFINLLCSDLNPFYYEKDTRKWSKKELKNFTDTGSIEKVDFNFSNFHLKRSGCTMCIRKKFLEEISQYWIDNWAHDDFVWKMSVMDSSCAIIHRITVKRRMHSNNATVVRVRTRLKRINQLKDFRKQFFILLNYNEKKIKKNNNTYIISKNIKSIDIRLKLIDRKRFLQFFKLLLFYRKCYPRIKGLFFDLYITIFKKYEGV